MTKGKRRRTAKWDRYLTFLSNTAKHRKKWLDEPVPDRRYIRGKINYEIENAVHSRLTGDVSFDPLVARRVLDKTGGLCYLCYRRYDPSKPDSNLTFSQLEVDHVIPFSKGGPNSISNYMPACRRCNRIKSNLSLATARRLLAKYRMKK